MVPRDHTVLNRRESSDYSIELVVLQPEKSRREDVSFLLFSCLTKEDLRFTAFTTSYPSRYLSRSGNDKYLNITYTDIL